MATFELHVWGSLDEAQSFLPDSLAAIWYVTLSVGSNTNNNVRIIQSSNPRLASNGQLPALKHKKKTYGGYQNIVRYLETIGLGLDMKYTPETQAKLKALVANIKSAMVPITLYTLFINKANYTGKTSPLLANMVPFPMQYSMTHEQKQYAESICASVGLVNGHTKSSGGTGTNAEWGALTESSKDDPTMNRIRKQLEIKHQTEQARKANLKSTRDTFRLINVANDVLEGLLELRQLKDQENDSNNSKWLFADGPNSADLFLCANLKIQTLPSLPDPVVKPLLSQKYPDLLEYARMDPVGRRLEVVKASGDDEYSLSSLVRAYIGVNTAWA